MSVQSVQAAIAAAKLNDSPNYFAGYGDVDGLEAVAICRAAVYDGSGAKLTPVTAKEKAAIVDLFDRRLVSLPSGSITEKLPEFPEKCTMSEEAVSTFKAFMLQYGIKHPVLDEEPPVPSMVEPVSYTLIDNLTASLDEAVRTGATWQPYMPGVTMPQPYGRVCRVPLYSESRVGCGYTYAALVPAVTENPQDIGDPNEAQTALILRSGGFAGRQECILVHLPA